MRGSSSNPLPFLCNRRIASLCATKLFLFSALAAKVRKLVLFHHDPQHDDQQLDEMLEAARMLALDSGQNLEIEAAQEGAELWLAPRSVT